MPVLVMVTKILGEEYATEEQLKDMTDREVVEMVKDDMAEFFEGAFIQIARGV